MSVKMFSTSIASFKEKVNKARVAADVPKEGVDQRGSVASLPPEQSFVAVMDENKRLKNEVEVLVEQRDQNAQLKSTVQTLIDEINALKANSETSKNTKSDTSVSVLVSPATIGADDGTTQNQAILDELKAKHALAMTEAQQTLDRERENREAAEKALRELSVSQQKSQSDHIDGETANTAVLNEKIRHLTVLNEELLANSAKLSASDTVHQHASEEAHRTIEILKSELQQATHLPNQDSQQHVQRIRELEVQLEEMRNQLNVQKEPVAQIDNIATTNLQYEEQIKTLNEQLKKLQLQSTATNTETLTAQVAGLERQLNEQKTINSINFDTQMQTLRDQHKQELEAVLNVQFEQTKTETEKLEQKHLQELNLAQSTTARLTNEIEDIKGQTQQTVEHLSEQQTIERNEYVAELSKMKDTLTNLAHDLEERRKTQELTTQEIQNVNATLKQKEDQWANEMEKSKATLTHRENALASSKMELYDLQMQLEQVQATQKATTLSQSELEKKLKTEYEQKLNKEKERLGADLDHVRKDLRALEQTKSEVTKKHEKEMESKREDIKQRDTKFTLLEKDMTTLKEKYSRQIDDQSKIIAELNANLTQNKSTVDKAVAEADKCRQEDERLRSEVERLTSQLGTVTAELEVAKVSNERNTNLLSEREQELKTIRASEATLKKIITRYEMDLSQLQATDKSQSARLIELEAALPPLELAKKQLDAQLLIVTAQLETLTTEKADLHRKCQDLEQDLKITERKGAQMVKDLQKELTRGKPRQQGNSMGSSNNLFADTSSSPTEETKSSTHKKGHGRMPSLSSKPIDDFSSIQHDKDTTRTNAIDGTTEERSRHFQERLKRVVEESALKSKTIQQLVLRENASFLDKSLKEKPIKINLEALTGRNTMQKLDPVLLSEINIKLQQLLEENTMKNIQLQEDIQNMSKELHTLKKGTIVHV